MPSVTEDSTGEPVTPLYQEQSVRVEYECVGCSTTGTEGYVTLGRGPICSNCLHECVACGGEFNINSGSEHAALDDGYACYRCTREHYFYCGGCDSYQASDDSSYIGCEGYTRCYLCVDRRYIYCEDCDEYNCESCYENCDSRSGGRYIHDYSHRPKPYFWALEGEVDDAPRITHESNRIMRTYAQIPFMGFELEVECEGGSSSFREGAELLVGDGEDVVYLKSDGSIHYGFEIVTHPMTLDWAMRNFPWDKLQRLRQMGFTGWSNDTCGLHIHVSRDGFISESHQARFIHFIVRNSEFMEFFAGRSNSRWSSFTREQLVGLKHKVRASYGNERYLAVNTNNPGTLEVRIFNASLSPSRVKMCLQMVNAIVCYTESLTAKDFIQGMAFSHSQFVEWVKQYHHDTGVYNNLVEYLNEWYEPFISGSRQIGE